VQQNASYAEEMASTAEELSSQSEHLQDIMNAFKVNDSGGIRQMGFEKTNEQIAGNPVVKQIAGAEPKALKRIGGKPVTNIKQAGVALKMGNGGKDIEDEEFERY